MNKVKPRKGLARVLPATQDGWLSLSLTDGFRDIFLSSGYSWLGYVLGVCNAIGTTEFPRVQ